MNRPDLLDWLHETDAGRLDDLWRQADAARREHVGDAVHLRGLIEISNSCVRDCWYCGLRKSNLALRRYRMTPEEILEAARRALALGYGTVVLQAGEDYALKADVLAAVIRRLKALGPLAVTLSLGERPEADLAVWREAGADRYLLRFETSNRTLYDRIHPPLPGRRSDRFAILRRVRDLGYETGSGIMVGLPGQTFDDVADDLEMFRTLDLDMIGLGPYIAHPATPLGQDAEALRAPPGRQVPNGPVMACKVIALTRLVCPRANIPSTTALATLDREKGRELGLLRGANVVMPNLTPARYRAMYEIYPAKACVAEPEDFDREIRRRIQAIGRTVGMGPGESPNWRRRHAAGCTIE